MDIVIPVKRAMINEELRYTLRSICKNVPHRKVWTAGYMPSFLNDDIGHIPVNVPFGNKYVKTSNNILQACLDKRVSDDFLLFNDDFFIMQPVEEFKILHRGTVADRLRELKEKKITGPYFKGLELTYQILQGEGIEEPLDYGLHTPMVMNRRRWVAMWKRAKKLNPNKRSLHLRTFYGNLYNIGGEQIKDVKIAEFGQKPTGKEIFLSSNDDSFVQGEIGRYVQSQFPEPCKYE